MPALRLQQPRHRLQQSRFAAGVRADDRDDSAPSVSTQSRQMDSICRRTDTPWPYHWARNWPGLIPLTLWKDAPNALTDRKPTATAISSIASPRAHLGVKNACDGSSAHVQSKGPLLERRRIVGGENIEHHRLRSDTRGIRQWLGVEAIEQQPEHRGDIDVDGIGCDHQCTLNSELRCAHASPAGNHQECNNPAGMHSPTAVVIVQMQVPIVVVDAPRSFHNSSCVGCECSSNQVSRGTRCHR